MRTAIGLVALVLGGCATAQAPQPAAAPPPPEPRPAIQPVPTPQPPQTMQYLYGSGEAAALSIGVYRTLVDFARKQVASRPAESVILSEESRLDAPGRVPCGDKPFAAVFDVDETLVANLGYEYYDATKARGYDATAWERWEKTGASKVTAIPGALYAVNALRQMGVAVIFNSNRSVANAEQTAAAIKAAGLGEAIHGQTLFLKGDDAGGSAKDGRRAKIAQSHCVIAMGGDQLGDFTDLFNQEGMTPSGRRMEAASGWAMALWGQGWFVLPNPVYGTALKGGFDDVFPSDKRWDDPAEEKK